MDVKSGRVDADPDEVDPVSTDFAGKSSDPTTFSLPDGINRIGSMASGSHLDDNPSVVVDRNEVDLSIGDLNVGVDNVEAAVCQEPYSEFLAEPSESRAGIP